MGVDGGALATILGMALVAYGCRVGGVWLIGKVTMTPRLEAGLNHVPGAVLVALVAPAAVAAGPVAVGAVALAMVLAYRTGNLPVAIAAGVAVVAGWRGLM